MSSQARGAFADLVASPQTLPFTEFEGWILHLEKAMNPWNIQLEIVAGERLDGARLSSALRAACDRHPLGRARLRHWDMADRAYDWVVPDSWDLDPVSCLDDVDSRALPELRTAFYSAPIPLDLSPPLRVALVRTTLDRVLFNFSHVSCDGVGALRFVQSVIRAYRELPDRSDPLDLADARGLDQRLEAPALADRATRALELARRALAALDTPTRIVIEADAAREGFGFTSRRLDPAHTAEVTAHRPPGATVNDLLLAALHRSIDRWNADHGVDSDRLAVMMPINMRPREWFWDIVSNFASFVSVSTQPEDREDLSSTIAAIARQTSPVYRTQRAGVLLDLMKLGEPLPVGLKQALPILLPLTGDRFFDTAVLSNLGRVPEAPSFDGGECSELWFSPPCVMPLGVGIGTVTVSGALHIVTRYRFEQFHPTAAETFTDLFMTQLCGG